MAMYLADSGPKLVQTRDNRIYDHFLNWKVKVECYLDSVLENSKTKQNTGYLRLWLGDEAQSLIRKWTFYKQIGFLSSRRNIQ